MRIDFFHIIADHLWEHLKDDYEDDENVAAAVDVAEAGAVAEAVADDGGKICFCQNIAGHQWEHLKFKSGLEQKH